MTPDALARLHARCFAVPPPWDAASFAALLADPHVFLRADGLGRAFALGRAVAGEAELLSLATDPAARRKGLARLLLAEFEGAARERLATTAFLEVAADNAAAQALYQAAGWRQAGRRRGYYRAPDRAPVDALILCKSLDAPLT